MPRNAGRSWGTQTTKQMGEALGLLAPAVDGPLQGTRGDALGPVGDAVDGVHRAKARGNPGRHALAWVAHLRSARPSERGPRHFAPHRVVA